MVLQLASIASRSRRSAGLPEQFRQFIFHAYHIQECWPRFVIEADEYIDVAFGTQFVA